jgi:hypothetical protein
MHSFQERRLVKQRVDVRIFLGFLEIAVDQPGN